MNTIKLNTIGEGPITKPSSEGGDKMLYIDLTVIDRDFGVDDKLCSMSSLAKATHEGFPTVLPSSAALMLGIGIEAWEAVAIDMGLQIIDPVGVNAGKVRTLQDEWERWKQHNTGFEDYQLTEISKTQFYSLTKEQTDGSL